MEYRTKTCDRRTLALATTTLAILFTIICGISQTAAAQDTIRIAAVGSLPVFQLTSDPTSTGSLTIRTEWDLPSVKGWADINICAYMTGDMTGTGTSTDFIPRSSVFINGIAMSGGGVNCGITGAILLGSERAFSGKSSPPNQRARNGYVEDLISVQLRGYPTTLSPDTYRGTISLITKATL